ncbi:MAG: hypothetical protein RMY31_016285 [Dendronalium sp. ChiSLP03b]|nr:hypothetical protein [Dendronalium sp. ChiSLP03b]
MTAITTPVLTDNKTLNEVVNCLTENIPIIYGLALLMVFNYRFGELGYFMLC